jgi:hypothetical protein
MSKRMVGSAAMAVALGLVSLSAAAQEPAGPQSGLRVEPLRIQTSHGPVDLQVEIADTDRSREIGMMFRKSSPDDRGMLFEFDRPEIQSFWMKNTLIPLDMIFVASDGRIVSIWKNAKPLTTSAETSTGPAVAVLEVRGGLADADHIRPGDKVSSPFFGH